MGKNKRKRAGNTYSANRQWKCTQQTDKKNGLSKQAGKMDSANKQAKWAQQTNR